MPLYVVLAAHSKCGSLTIHADSADDAAHLYSLSCCEYDATSRIWVWRQSDYLTDPNHRPDPMEFDARDLAQAANA